MRKTILGVFLISGFLFGGCAPSSQSTSQEQAPVTTLTGTISKKADVFILTEKTGKTDTINSYTAKLDQYIGKTITVSGQYSGTTLYVDTVNPIQ